MCVLSIKVPIRKKSGNLFNDTRIFKTFDSIGICISTHILHRCLNRIRLYGNLPWRTSHHKPCHIFALLNFAKTFLDKKNAFGNKYYEVMKEKLKFLEMIMYRFGTRKVVSILVCGIGTWRVKSKKVERLNIIAKKCKIGNFENIAKSAKLKILGKNFWQGTEMGIGRCWQVGKIKLFTGTGGNWEETYYLSNNIKMIPKPGKS